MSKLLSNGILANFIALFLFIIISNFEIVENFVSNQNQRRNRRFTEHFHAFANICLKPSPEHRYF